jgi:hypothetical protein
MLEHIISAPGWLRTALQAAALGLILWWLCWRSGSSHLLLARIWSIVQGKPQAGDRTVRQFLAKRSSLMQFRAVTGIRCATLAQTHRLLEWAEANDEEIGDIARCKGYFDIRRPGLPPNPPALWEIIFSFIIFAACTALFMLACGASLSDRAWGSIKNGSGTMLLIGNENIGVWRTGQYFNGNDCAKVDHETIAMRVGLPAKELTTACGWFGDPSLPTYVEKTVREQRIGLSVLAVVLIGYGLPAYHWFAAMIAANGMRKRQRRRQGAPRGMTEETQASQNKADAKYRVAPEECVVDV